MKYTIHLFLFFWAFSTGLTAQTAVQSSLESLSAPERYVRNYATLAVEEMYYSGVPASIKLAQGILESSSGGSRLSTDGFNHFGIKCKSNWLGDTLLVEDDDYVDGKLTESCFRKYESDALSYRDHSEFLRQSPRYASLFELEKNDFTAWAQGLKACGYATNPNYANILISLIERYHLFVFDRVPEDGIASCLDYYDTHRYVYAHQLEQGTLSESKPIAVAIPKNYKGGWLRENTRMRILTTLIKQGGDHKSTEDATASTPTGFLAFQISAEESAGASQ